VDYVEALTQIRTILDSNRMPAAAAEQTVRFLRESFPHYSWVGIYWLSGQTLVLGPWDGPEATQHTRIPIGKGVCGAAAVSGRTEVVDDVTRDSRYLACFPSTRSEIVVPIRSGGTVVGEIDIDSSKPSAFSRVDQEFLETVAALLAPLARGDTGTPLTSTPPGGISTPPGTRG
jgi:L-methionine (R)-S-oxide reductase